MSLHKRAAANKLPDITKSQAALLSRKSRHSADLHLFDTGKPL